MSHNAAAIKALCSKAVLLTNGAVTALGGVSDVTALYSSGTASAGSTREWRDPGSAPGNESIRLSYVRIIPPEGTDTITIDTGASIEIGFDNLRKDVNLDCTVYLVSGDGVVLLIRSHYQFKLRFPLRFHHVTEDSGAFA